MSKAPMPVSLLTEAALSKRSALYVWMLENHDTFAEVVAKAGRPNWKALAEAFGAQGYTDSDGQSPSDEVTRQTWWRVRKTVKARRAKRPTSPATELKTATDIPPPLLPPTQPTREAINVQPSRPGTFNFSPTPKEDDKERLLGKPANRKG
jgi:hypothetical protein